MGRATVEPRETAELNFPAVQPGRSLPSRRLIHVDMAPPPLGPDRERTARPDRVAEIILRDPRGGEPLGWLAAIGRIKFRGKQVQGVIAPRARFGLFFREGPPQDFLG